MKKRIVTTALIASLLLMVLFYLCSCNNRTDNTMEFQSFQEYAEKGVVVNSKICNVKNDYKGIVTIISDDGYYESGVILNELAKELNINVTVAGAVNIISPKINEWKRIEREGHVDIVSHSYSHIKVSSDSNLTKEQIRHEYVCAKEWYEKFFKTPSFTIVAPENVTTSYGFSVWKEIGILAARLGARGENSLSEKIEYGTEPGQWLNLKIRGLYDASDTIGRNAWVDSAAENCSWIIEMWHDISPNGDVHFQPISTEKARQHLEYLATQQNNNKVWAASFTQAVSYIYQRDYGQVEAFLLDDSIAVSYTRLRNDLPWDDFNVPVTIKLSIPLGFVVESVYRDAKKINYTIENDSIVFDIPTDGTTIYIK